MPEPETFPIPSESAYTLSNLVEDRIETLRAVLADLSPKSKLRRAEYERELGRLIPVANACEAEVVRQLGDDLGTEYVTGDGQVNDAVLDKLSDLR